MTSEKLKQLNQLEADIRILEAVHAHLKSMEGGISCSSTDKVNNISLSDTTLKELFNISSKHDKKKTAEVKKILDAAKAQFSKL